MELANAFDVDASPQQVWLFLSQVEGVVPCMPGAELTEVVDERTWRGRVRVKLGPVAMTYKGQVVLEEQDDDDRRMVLRGTGTETGGKGTASAAVVVRVEPWDPTAAGGARVTIVQDLTLSGPAAQYGRGMIGDVSRRLTDQFARCLREQLMASPESAATVQPQALGGLRLLVWTLWQALRRLVTGSARRPT